MITIEINTGAASEALARAAARLGDMTPLMGDLGEMLRRSTKARFPTGKAPDGTPWAAKSPATLEKYRRDGERADPRPLFGPSGTLSRTIAFAAGPDYLELGSNAIYAAVMQFGAKAGQFGAHIGKDKLGRDHFHSIPWGDIPARPFLGLSDEDEVNIVAEIEDWLSGAVGVA